MSTAFLADLAPAVDPTIAPEDGMYCRYLGDDGAQAHYAESGRTALRCIRAALAAAGKDPATVHRILDLPCGYGRILRVLKAAYPHAALTACDIERNGFDFCARQFGAEPVYSNEDPAKIPVSGPFDLIWCGSLLTHLDAPRWPGFLARFRSLLSPDGLCLFTTHGVGAVEYVTHGMNDYGIARPDKAVRRMTRTGFGFQSYASGGYGISFSTPAWVAEQVRRLPDTRFVLFLEKGWHNHQDAVAIGPLPPPDWKRGG